MSEQQSPIKIVRKLQKSKTGFYINIPIKVARGLGIDGSELVKFTVEPGSNRLSVEIVKP